MQAWPNEWSNAGRLADFELVTPPNARTEHADVRAVDVERDSQFVAAVSDVMNVTGRNERGDATDRIDGVTSHNQVLIRTFTGHFVNGFIFLPAVDAHHAPRNMIVNRRRLTRPPDERDDGEAAIGFDVQNVLPVFFFAGGDLFWPEKILQVETGPQKVGYGRAYFRRIVLGLHNLAHRLDQVTQGQAEGLNTGGAFHDANFSRIQFSTRARHAEFA